MPALPTDPGDFPDVVPQGGTSAEPGAATAFAPVSRSPRLSDVVAEQMMASITARRLPPGSRLASERELGEQFGVSRTVIREAIRSLAAKGLLVVRPGSGVLVAAVDAASVSEQMNLFLRGRGDIEYDKVNEVRHPLEIETARFAAQRADAAEIDEMRAHCERMEAAPDSESASRQDVEFHRAIARATHNELFIVMLDSIGDILLEIRRRSLTAPGRTAAVAAHHRRILDRIAAHDAAGAEAAMRAHLEESSTTWARVGRDAD